MSVSARSSKNHRRIVEAVEPLFSMDYGEMVEDMKRGMLAGLQRAIAAATKPEQTAQVPTERSDLDFPSDFDPDRMAELGNQRGAMAARGELKDMLSWAERARILSRTLASIADGLAMHADSEVGRRAKEQVRFAWAALYGSDPVTALLESVNAASEFRIWALEQLASRGVPAAAIPPAYFGQILRALYSLHHPDEAAKMDLSLAARAIAAWSVRGRQKKGLASPEKWQTIRKLARSVGLHYGEETLRTTWKRWRAMRRTSRPCPG